MVRKEILIQKRKRERIRDYSYKYSPRYILPIFFLFFFHLKKINVLFLSAVLGL